MKKMTLQMMDVDAEKAALVLADMGIMHPMEMVKKTSQLPEYPAESYAEVFHSLNSRFNKIASYIELEDLKKIDLNTTVSLQQLEEGNRILQKIWSEVSHLEEQLRQRNEKLQAVRQLFRSLQKFATLDLDLSRLRQRGLFLNIIVGTVPSANFYRLKHALSLASYMINPFYLNEGIEHVVVFGSNQQEQDVDELLRSADFRQLFIPAEFTGSPTDLHRDIDNQLSQLNEEAADFRLALSDLLSNNLAILNQIHALLVRAEPYASLANTLRGRGSLVSLQGWITASNELDIMVRLESDLEYPFCLQFADPEISEYQFVPTLLKTSKMLLPFQKLVRNFDIPGYTEVDPSGYFAVSYILMFGMMFGDVGHGLVIAIAGAIAFRQFPVAAVAIIFAGLSSMFFGFIYGSVFGYEQLIRPLWMSPMHDPVQMLLVAVAWGIGFLTIAYLIAIRNFIAAGIRYTTLYSPKGVAGLLFYLSTVYLAFQLVVNADLSGVEILLPLVPLAMIVFSLWRESTGGLVERLLVVVIEALEQLISNISGTLSFLRVAAFSLNHIALAAAVFSIADMMSGAGHWVAIVLGNCFIIVLEAAIVAIQCLRLEYYEGFSRFFSGKGKAYKPLKLNI